MNTFDFIRLFRAVLSPRAVLDTQVIERMGLLAVKIAQMYAVRPDLVGIEKSLQLSRLLQRAAPLEPEEFDQRWAELAPGALRADLAELNREPLAAASLGQAHRARLRDGRELVVKILKRDIRDKFVRDVEQLRRWLRLGLLVYPRLERLADPLGTLETVAHQTLTEMNFLAEQAGASRLATLASQESWRLEHLQRLNFPKHFAEYSHERLLVSEFVPGRTLAEWLEQGGLPYEVLLELFRIHGYFLFVRGEFHGDLHPGNVIWRDGHFWFLDNANIETIPPAFARGLFDMLVLLGEGDTTRAAQRLADLSITPLPAARFRRFQSDFVALYDGFAQKPIREVSLTQQMMKTVKLAVTSGINFPRGAFPLVKSLMYLDGMVLRAAPQATLLRDVGQFADDFGPPTTLEATCQSACTGANGPTAFELR